MGVAREFWDALKRALSMLFWVPRLDTDPLQAKGELNILPGLQGVHRRGQKMPQELSP